MATHSSSKSIMDPISRARNGDTNFFKRVPVEYFQHLKDAAGHSVLFISVEEDHLLCSKAIIERCPLLLNEVDSQRRHTPLHIAASRGVPQIVKLLADASEERIFMITDDRGHTPLHVAVEHHNFEAFKLLLEAFPDHESQFQNRHLNPLPWFVSEQSDEGRCHSHDLVKVRKLYLEKFPSQCNLRTGDKGWTPLHLATSKFQLDAIKDIIHFCPDCVNLVDNEGQNFLHIVVDLDFFQVVDYVLQAKEIADSILNVQNNDGMSPLDIAVKRGDKKMLKCLKKSVNNDDKEGEGVEDTKNDFLTPLKQDLYRLLVKKFGNILQSTEPDKSTSLALSGLLSLVDEMRKVDEDDVSEEQIGEWENKVTEYGSLGMEVSWLNRYLSLFRDQSQARGQLKGEIAIKEKVMESMRGEYQILYSEVEELERKLFNITFNNDYFAFLDE